MAPPRTAPRARLNGGRWPVLGAQPPSQATALDGATRFGATSQLSVIIADAPACSSKATPTVELAHSGASEWAPAHRELPWHRSGSRHTHLLMLPEAWLCRAMGLVVAGERDVDRVVSSGSSIESVCDRSFDRFMRKLNKDTSSYRSRHDRAEQQHRFMTTVASLAHDKGI